MKDGIDNKPNISQEEDYCDIFEGKICDSCCKCIESDRDFSSIKIDRIIMEHEDKADN